MLPSVRSVFHRSLLFIALLLSFGVLLACSKSRLPPIASSNARSHPPLTVPPSYGQLQTPTPSLKLSPKPYKYKTK